MGKALMGVGFAVGAVVYLLTIGLLFVSGQLGLAVVALLVPPADLVLAFVVSPTLGVALVAATLLVIAGAALDAKLNAE